MSRAVFSLITAERLVNSVSSEDDVDFYLANIGCTHRTLLPLIQRIVSRQFVVRNLYLGGNNLEDITGKLIAEYVAKGTTIEELDLNGNKLGARTYFALAEALKVNSSLRSLYMCRNTVKYSKPFIDKAFVEALWVNPDRPKWSVWHLYKFNTGDSDYDRLSRRAERTRYHPSLQLLLIYRC